MIESSENTFRDSYMELHKKEGILFCKFSDDLDVDLKIAKHCVEKRVSFSNKKSYPAIIDMKGVRSVTKEAREYMAEEGAQLLLAGALIVSSPVSRIIGNLFLKINKPKIPTMLFTDPEDAKKWISSFIPLN
jgi:hypothetical protein